MKDNCKGTSKLFSFCINIFVFSFLFFDVAESRMFWGGQKASLTAEMATPTLYRLWVSIDSFYPYPNTSMFQELGKGLSINLSLY